MRGADWTEPLEPYRPMPEAWEDTAAEEEGAPRKEPDLEDLARSVHQRAA
jgi:hypothetical protein